MLEMGGQTTPSPPNHAAYFTPQAPTFQHPAPPATIHVPPQPGPTMQMQPPQPSWTATPQYQQQTPQYQQQGDPGLQNRRKKRRNNGGGYGGGYGGTHFGNHSQTQPRQHGNYVQPQHQPTGNQYNRDNQYGHSNQYGPPQGRQPIGRGNGVPYSNAVKQHMNLCYCFSCGYDVDHMGFQCPTPRNDHIPTVKREDAHTIWGASMKAQHKTLPDGTGAGMGWILAQNLRKANFVMDKREENAQQWRRRQAGR
jgi:hypothetical protein